MERSGEAGRGTKRKWRRPALRDLDRSRLIRVVRDHHVQNASGRSAGWGTVSRKTGEASLGKQRVKMGALASAWDTPVGGVGDRAISPHLTFHLSASKYQVKQRPPPSPRERLPGWNDRNRGCLAQRIGNGRQIAFGIIAERGRVVEWIGHGGNLVVDRLIGHGGRHGIRRRRELDDGEGVALRIGAVSSHRAMLYSVRRERKEGSTR